jgi:phosphoribosylamine--glycine ligase
MKVLIIGSGGREHALGWKIASESSDNEIHFLPGNGGTLEIGSNIAAAATDLEAVIQTAGEISPDLMVVGPEDPLASGVVNRLDDLGFTVFGPTAAGAGIESSKAFAKDLMSRYSIPTAPYKTFTSESNAHAFIDKTSKPLVVKADGLARGKGSIVTASKEEAHRAVDLIMGEKAFGDAGDTVVVEERLTGEEASVLAITDGEHYVVLPPSQDHKPAYDGDEGPNTGGMGAYCPAPVVDRDTLAQIEQTVLKRILKGLRQENIDYRGVIYAGLMINDEGAFVIEFNSRFGDPETQCMMPVIDVNLGGLLTAAAQGRLEKTYRIEAARWAVSVVMASGGYPGAYQKGKTIRGVEEASACKGINIFHAGTTRLEGGELVTSGGRVLAVTGTGGTLREARRKVYDAGRLIKFEDMHMRTDIGLKGLARLQKTGVS